MNHRFSRPGVARREFLLATAGATAALLNSINSRAQPSTPAQLVDCNVWLGRWPIRRLPHDEPAALAAKLQRNGVTSAWVSSLDGIFHKDIESVNARLVETSQVFPIFAPFGMVNPTLPRWEADVEACAANKMRGIRFLPAYHGYKLDDPRFVDALKLATSLGLRVQLALVLEDARTQNRLMQAPPPDISPLPRTLATVPGARVMLLNWLRSMAGKAVLLSLQSTDLYFDIGLLEGIAGIETTLEDLPVERLCFGSHAPVFYHEAAKLKLQESDLTPAQMAAITHQNAARFLA